MGHLEWFLLVPAAATIVYLAYRSMRYGGFKAGLFGSRIIGTAGELTLAGRASVVRVYVLGGEFPEKAIGIEAVTSNQDGYSMSPLVLSRDEATQLATLLQVAVRDSQRAHH